MSVRDSVDKIVTYMAAVTAEPFNYKGSWHAVPDLYVSPLLLRGFTCPEQCGGCCPRFSLDYLPEEKRPYKMHTREVLFDGRSVMLYSDLQDDHSEHHCRNLNHDNGRCKVHGSQPFSCDFELIRFMHYSDTNVVRASTRLFGRGWNMLRVDGERGARCTITPPSAESRADTLRKLARLEAWCSHFGLRTRIHHIVDWVHAGAHETLHLPAKAKKGFFNVVR